MCSPAGQQCRPPPWIQPHQGSAAGHHRRALRPVVAVSRRSVTLPGSSPPRQYRYCNSNSAVQRLVIAASTTVNDCGGRVSVTVQASGVSEPSDRCTPARVGGRGSLVVDPAVDAPAEMLDEAAEDIAVQVAGDPSRVDRDSGHCSSISEHARASGWPAVGRARIWPCGVPDPGSSHGRWRRRNGTDRG